MHNTVQDSPELFKCATNDRCNGTVLVSIGNTLRQDDGIAQELLDSLSKNSYTKFCRFDVGTYSNYLLECLKGHDTAIIVDSIANNGNPGKVTVLDLNEAIRRRQTLKLNSCHGFSLMDELQLAGRRNNLPSRLLFFGIEANSCQWTEGLTSVLKEKLPEITRQLQSVIESMSEATGNA